MSSAKDGERVWGGRGGRGLTRAQGQGRSSIGRGAGVHGRARTPSGPDPRPGGSRGSTRIQVRRPRIIQGSRPLHFAARDPARIRIRLPRPAHVEFPSRRSTVSSFELCLVHAPFYYLFHSYSRTLSLHGHPAPTRGFFATSPAAALYQPGWALWLPLRILAGQAACPPASESLPLTLAIRP